EELIEDGITRRPAPRPLRVQARLRPEAIAFGRDEALLRGVRIELRRLAVDVGFVRGPAPSRLVHDVHRVALPQEELRPPFASVRRPREVGPRLRAAVD